MVELRKFDIKYVSRKAIKTQVLGEVLADFAEGKCEELEGKLRIKVCEDAEQLRKEGFWELQVDGSSTKGGIKLELWRTRLKGRN